jgi:hypothetical protein
MKKLFDRILIIIFENELESAVRENPFMRELESKGVRMSEYYGVAHPSQPNYIAATSGNTFVTNDDCTDLDVTNIVDLLEHGKVTWKAYMEGLPQDKAVCISEDSLYFRKHNPFVSYNNVRENPDRLAKIVNAAEFYNDFAACALPQFCWYTPNIFDDGHTPQSIPDLANWLQEFWSNLKSHPKQFDQLMNESLVVITFDESIPHADNHIYTTLLGSAVKAGSTQSERYNHYSLLRTIEENFNLGTLGRFDATANWFTFLWGMPPAAFDWSLHNQHRD